MPHDVHRGECYSNDSILPIDSHATLAVRPSSADALAAYGTDADGTPHMSQWKDQR